MEVRGTMGEQVLGADVGGTYTDFLVDLEVQITWNDGLKAAVEAKYMGPCTASKF